MTRQRLVAERRGQLARIEAELQSLPWQQESRFARQQLDRYQTLERTHRERVIAREGAKNLAALKTLLASVSKLDALTGLLEKPVADQVVEFVGPDSLGVLQARLEALQHLAVELVVLSGSHDLAELVITAALTLRPDHAH